MEEVKKLLTKKIQDSLKNLVGEDQNLEIQLSHPENLSHGDLTTNVAMQIFPRLATSVQRQAFSSPKELAQKIVDELQEDSEVASYFSKISVERPGFINFWLDTKYLFESLKNITTDKEYGRSNNLKDKKIMVEFTDPNPFKEFHIGHLYSNTVGESIARLLESQGADVKRVCYQGDVGLHVAKAIFGIKRKIHDSGFTIQDLEKKTFEEKAKFLGEAYALGATEFEEDEEAKQEIIALNKKIFDLFERHSGDPDSSEDARIKEGSWTSPSTSSGRSQDGIGELYEKGKAWSLEYFDALYTRLGMKFWKLYFESEAGKVGLSIVSKHLEDGVFIESEGATIFPGEKYGLHNRVFINSLGLPTYEAKELGLAPTKYHDFAYDTSIIITGNEVNAYFQVVLKALNIINPELAAKTIHKSHGMVRLPSGKMSSRTGKIITGEWLLDEAKSQIATKYNDMSSETLEKVSIAAVKYALLRSSVGNDIEFNFDESISLDGNSGPYLQYAYVRTQSVLAKSEFKIQNSELQLKSQNWEKEEEELLRFLLQYPTVVEDAAESYSPNTISTYLFNLAQKFNLFYQKHSILTPSVILNEEKNLMKKKDPSVMPQDDNLRDFRLSLTAAVGNVLKNGLCFLGIETVEKM